MKSINLPGAVLHKKGGRASRPAPLLRKNTANSELLGDLRSPKKVEREEKPDMAASFLQFCAMCEKQIAVPNNSVLYCSESCRRKDSCKPLSASLPGSAMHSNPPSPPSTPSSPRVILRPFMPTAAPSTTASSPSRIPSDQHSHKSDLDPTEWKPKIHRRGHSEAFRYLSQFQTSSDSSSGFDGELMDIRRRSYASRGSTSGASAPGTPGLSHSPVTAASSLNSMAGLVGYESITYDFSQRPLPPRQKSFCAGSVGTGLDLVTPHIAPPTPSLTKTVDPTIDSQGLFWEKKTVAKSLPRANEGESAEGLGKLLREAK